MGKAIAMFSGGKDSTFAVHIALLQGFDIAALVTFKPSSSHPWYIHRPFVEYTNLQTSLLPLKSKHIIIDVATNDKKEEVQEIKKALETLYTKIEFDYIVLGVISSDAQRMLFTEICDSIGIKLYTPFWGKDPSQHLLDIVSSNIEFIITSINAWGLPTKFLGHVIDSKLASEIIALSKRYGFNPSFEGGEAETFVIYTPLFRNHRICVEYDVTIVSEYEGYVKPKNVYVC
ncbi:diphthine--ammonia ligase [Ignisphaera sp. 4213-co]|uniref:Diphthine--ammonia ligase n=1 Tax=Ignisphaera cupida TaxID=3050454 RepID=A0ABD4Z9U4_9CREN|nr:diphthine--ammonia ligase [Ignisphaera sp. 4213-co]MDK6029479.1 diphthine--ammonia ligase [Ignisphaera sp. 4213-co]